MVDARICISIRPTLRGDAPLYHYDRAPNSRSECNWPRNTGVRIAAHAALLEPIFPNGTPWPQEL